MVTRKEGVAMRQMFLASDAEKISMMSMMRDAVKDRFALIIPEQWESFANCHIPEILKEYPCTGILVDKIGPGVVYHKCPADAIDSILADGIRPTNDECATFGDSVIYTYPTREPFELLRSDIGIFEIHYKSHCLKSIYTVDKDDILQGETLIFPEDVVAIKLIERR